MSYIDFIFEREKPTAYQQKIYSGYVTKLNSKKLFDQGYTTGFPIGFKSGVDVAYPKGYKMGYGEGADIGFDEGKYAGFSEGFETDKLSYFDLKNKKYISASSVDKLEPKISKLRDKNKLKTSSLTTVMGKLTYGSGSKLGKKKDDAFLIRPNKEMIIDKKNIKDGKLNVKTYSKRIGNNQFIN